MFSLTSKHRTSLMGISALIILVHHYFTNIMDKPYKFGAIGVDTFMFLMGIGLYFSLYEGIKNKSFLKELPAYFFRRFKKIFPVFAVFLVSFGLWKFSNGGFSLKDFFLNLSLTGYWTLPYGKYFNWFVSGILFFYLLSPVLFLFFHKSKSKMLCSTLIFAVLSVLVFLMRKNSEGDINRTLIMVVRLIPLSFGMLFGSYCKEQPSEKEKRVVLISFGAIFIIGVALYILNNVKWNDSGFTYGMPWYSFGLMTPFLCLFFSYIMEFISKSIHFIECILTFFGKMSFEIYLTHVFIIEYIMIVLIRKKNLWSSSQLINFIYAFVLSTLFAYVLNCFSKKVSEFKIIKKIKDKR